MSRTTSIAGVRPLGWLARVRAQRKCLAWVCPVQLLGAAGLAPITALGMGARDDHARQRSGPGQWWCRRKSEKLLETGRGSESAAAHVSLTMIAYAWEGFRYARFPAEFQKGSHCIFRFCKVPI